MKNYIELTSKISSSGGTSTSLKTTIPKVILEKMEVESGDRITWRVFDNDNKVEIIFMGDLISTHLTKNNKIRINHEKDKKRKTSKLIAKDNSTNKQITWIGTTHREEKEIEKIIKETIECKTEEQIKNTFDKYREKEK